MKVEELLAMLHDGGMDDNAIQALLQEALNSLGGNNMENENQMSPEDAEKQEASDLFGVNL